MNALSKELFKQKMHELGFVIEHFPDSSAIRISPPILGYLLCIPCNSSIPFDIECLNGPDLFYCIGREGKLAFVKESIPPVGREKRGRMVHRKGCMALTCKELKRLINETRSCRCGSSDDFYAIPVSGTFMLYVSHHDEVLLYFGWSKKEQVQFPSGSAPMTLS